MRRYRTRTGGTNVLKLVALTCILWSVVTTPAHADEPVMPLQQPSLQERLTKMISVDFRDIPVEDVVRSIAEQADVDVVLSPNVTGRMTVKLTDVTLEEALRSILEVHGFDYVVGDNIVRILSREEMPQVPERQTTQIVEITYADVSEVVKSLEGFKSETGSISHIQGTSHILITDRETKVRAMMDFIEQVDRITPQVLVEARIYDITSKDRFDLGVQWDAGTGTTYDDAGNPLIDSRTEPFAKGGFAGTVAKAENTTAGVRLGWLSSSLDIDALISAQQEKVNAKLLANPRILVLDNETAQIKIVSEIPYQELQESSMGGSVGTTAFREVGVELHVTPHLAKRDQMVRLDLKPVFSVVTGEVQVAGVNVTYPQPVVDRREAETKLLVKNGQTIVLGGLRKKEVTKQINKVPFLGDLPIAGALFKYMGEDTINSELLVFITPWIVNQPTMTEDEIQSYKETEMRRINPVHTQFERDEAKGQEPSK